MTHLQKEIALHKQGYCFVAGIDEAGRGAWAGPVVAGAVVFPRPNTNLADELAGVRDSKKLSASKRAYLFDIIQGAALAVAVGVASAAQVDKLNVVGATRHAMQQAIERLAPGPDYLLIDHLKLPHIALPQDAFPKADDISLSVAAASIIAKVTRDRLMVDLHQTYPKYSFHRHKGYGTKIHRQALAKHGPCPAHRMSYRPVQRHAPPAP